MKQAFIHLLNADGTPAHTIDLKRVARVQHAAKESLVIYNNGDSFKITPEQAKELDEYLVGTDEPKPNNTELGDHPNQD